MVEALAHERNEALALKASHLPKLLVGDGSDPARPFVRVVQHVRPVRADALLKERAQQRRDPRRGVDAVRHGADGHLFDVLLGPHLVPKLARALAVLAAHAVRRAAHAQRQRRQAEQLFVVALLHAAEVKKLVAREPERVPVARAEALLDESCEELVVAGGNRRVRRERAALAHTARGLLKLDARLGQLARQLKGKEGRVSFIEMEDVRLNLQLSEQTHAADAQDHLLHTARLAVAAVEVAGDEAVNLVVALPVRVEQVERHAPDLDTPSLHAHVAATNEEVDADGLAVTATYKMHRQIADVYLLVRLLLPAVAAQVLTEVAVMIEQADGDKRKAQVARRLQVVAREDAEAARVERQRVMHAELRAEVCDRVLVRESARVACGPSLVPRSHVGVEAFGEKAHALDVDGVGRHPHQAVLRHLFEQAARVVLALVPDLLVEVAEDGVPVRVPAPPVVARDALQGLDGLRKRRRLRGLFLKLSRLDLSHHLNHSSLSDFWRCARRQKKAAGRQEL